MSLLEVKPVNCSVIDTRAKCPLIDKMKMLLFMDCLSLPGNLCPIINNFHFLSYWLSINGPNFLVLFGLIFSRMFDTRADRLTGLYSNCKLQKLRHSEKILIWAIRSSLCWGQFFNDSKLWHKSILQIKVYFHVWFKLLEFQVADS